MRSLKSEEFEKEMGTFWNCLSAYDQKLWYANEVHLRQELQMKTMKDESLELLRTESCYHGAVIKGCPNYDLLTNVYYTDKFQY